MNIDLRTLAVALALSMLASCADERGDSPASPAGGEITAIERTDGEAATFGVAAEESFETETADGVRIHGDLYSGGLDRSTPLILAFHQGGSNGRGEYGPIAPWLNRHGYRVMAWDQRAGGETHGESNRTVAELPEGTAAGYCDAYADLQAALNYVLSHGLGDDVVVWGSSYSAALVFQLAARNPGHVGGVIAFSPAAGGPLAECRARDSLDAVRVPMLVLRPAAEMERESSREQQAVFTAAGATFHVVENGVHGSSMLVDARTGNDMSDARATVTAWLDSLN